MTRETMNLDDKVYDYLLSVSLRESDVLRQLREETASHQHADLQVSPDEGQFLAFLVKMLNAGKVIEIGVFTGYSSLWMAEALPDDGKLIACDVNEDYTRIARKYWKLAGVEHKIELKLAPALETLDALLESGAECCFDFIFIDALKVEYIDYFQRSLKLLRQGGVMAVDNTLWHGKAADPENNEKLTLAIRKFNTFAYESRHVDLCLIPLGDGLTLCRKR